MVLFTFGYTQNKYSTPLVAEYSVGCHYVIMFLEDSGIHDQSTKLWA